MNAKTPKKPADTVLLESNPEEETTWLRAVANGDRTAFRQLHQRFRAILFTTIYRVLNQREDTEDVLQEVLAQVWAKAHMYEPGKGKPLTWINTMARNRAIDRYRSKQRRSKLGERYEDFVTTAGKPAASDTEAEVHQHETGRLLRAAVIELTPEQRESIELAYFGGLTQREVAEKIGQQVGTVKARIRRGIQRLEKTVDGKMS